MPPGMEIRMTVIGDRDDKKTVGAEQTGYEVMRVRLEYAEVTVRSRLEEGLESKMIPGESLSMGMGLWRLCRMMSES